MSFLDGTQSPRVVPCWRCSAAAFDLDEDDLQRVPAPHGTNRSVMIFANCQHIHDASRLSTGLSLERDELPTCARYNASNPHLRHGYGRSCGARCFFYASRQFTDMFRSATNRPECLRDSLSVAELLPLD